MIRELFGWLCPAWGFALFFGGDSTSNPETNNTDMRVVGGDDSTNQSFQLEGVGATVNVLDAGAINGALQLALRGVEGAQQTARETVEANGSLLSGALKMANDQQKAMTETVANIKTSDVRVLIIAGLAVVGLAAAFYARKG